MKIDSHKKISVNPPQTVIVVMPGDSLYNGVTNIPFGVVGASFGEFKTDALKNVAAISDVGAFFAPIDMGEELPDGGPMALEGEQPKAGDLNIYKPASVGGTEYFQTVHFNQTE